MHKQSDILLNSDDLDAMWLTLRENYLLHEATASEKVTYEDFSQIASLCTGKMAESARIDMSELDEDSDGFLQPYDNTRKDASTYLHFLECFPSVDQQ
uniref:Uncharacterized protein n=1 Tax=Lactuca sativa TaxID=4236 RepID=A0A9R1WFX5_LACSA|nr:hypothetical protein LSAT_V11C100045660 [Lactuca sativa]